MRQNAPPQKRGGGPIGRGPMGPHGMLGEKPKDFRRTLRTFISYLKPYRFTILLVMVFAVASTAFNIVGPKLLGNATTKLFEGMVAKAMQVPGAAIDFGYIGNIALILIGLYVFSAVFAYIQGYIMAGVAMKFTYQLRKRVSEKIRKLPLKYFDKKTFGEVQTYIINDIDTINMTLTQSLTQIITSVATIIGVLIMMLSISWLMTLVALVILPVSYGLISVIIKKSQKYFRSQQDYLGHVNGHVEEMYSGHIVMKAFNGEKKSIREFDGLNKVLYEAYWKSQFLASLMMPIMNFVGNLAYVGVCILGAF